MHNLLLLMKSCCSTRFFHSTIYYQHPFLLNCGLFNQSTIDGCLGCSVFTSRAIWTFLYIYPYELVQVCLNTNSLKVKFLGQKAYIFFSATFPSFLQNYCAHLPKEGLLRIGDTGVEGKEAIEKDFKLIINGVVFLRKVQGHRIKNMVFTKNKVYMPSQSINSGLYRKCYKRSQLRNFDHSFTLLEILWPNLLEILLSCRIHLLPAWFFW